MAGSIAAVRCGAVRAAAVRYARPRRSSSNAARETRTERRSSRRWRVARCSAAIRPNVSAANRKLDAGTITHRGPLEITRPRLSRCTYGAGVLAATVSDVELSTMSRARYATARTARTDDRAAALRTKPP